VILSGSNLANPAISVGGLGAAILGSTSSQVTFQVPFGLPAGPAVLRFTNGVDTGAVVVQIDAAPPGVLNVAGSNNARIDGSRPARAGDLLNVLVSGLTDTGGAIDPRRVHVSIAGVDHSPSSIAPMGGAHQVAVVLSPSVAAGEAPLTVSIGGRNSQPYYLPVVK
jgi:uncharacterized protein (TIGR03437 family)